MFNYSSRLIILFNKLIMLNGSSNEFENLGCKVLDVFSYIPIRGKITMMAMFYEIY